MGINQNMFSIISEGIKKNKILYEIDFSHNEINHHSMNSIEKFRDSKVNTLNFSHNPIHDTGILNFSKFLGSQCRYF
jgi:hypothetical protein